MVWIFIFSFLGVFANAQIHIKGDAEIFLTGDAVLTVESEDGISESQSISGKEKIHIAENASLQQVTNGLQKASSKKRSHFNKKSTKKAISENSNSEIKLTVKNCAPLKDIRFCDFQFDTFSLEKKSTSAFQDVKKQNPAKSSPNYIFTFALFFTGITAINPSAKKINDAFLRKLQIRPPPSNFI